MRNFFAKLRYSLQRFMYGRYGADEFYKFLTILVYILLILNIFIKNNYINIAIMVLITYSIFRILSKNYNRRSKENQIYLSIKNKVISFFKFQKRKFTEKDYVFKTCPNCKQKLRLPKKKGKHTVNCPKCHKDFDVRI